MSQGDQLRPDADLTAEGAALEGARTRRTALGSAADRIEELTARPGSDPRWPSRVLEALDQLDEVFGAHVDEVEHDDGLLPQLRRDAPRVSNGVDRMYAEHISISMELDETRALVRRCDDDCDPTKVDAIREAVIDLLRSISRHRQRGADLVYEAYNVDIGGG